MNGGGRGPNWPGWRPLPPQVLGRRVDSVSRRALDARIRDQVSAEEAPEPFYVAAWSEVLLLGEMIDGARCAGNPSTRPTPA